MENQNKLVISIAPNVYEGIKSSRYSDDRIDELILRGNDLLDDLCWSDTVNPENEKTINAWVDITEHIRPKERE